MTDPQATTISRMSAADATQVSKLITEVIQALPYYNDRARREEIAKYSAESLAVYAAEDPDAILVAWQDAVPVGFCISRYDDGVIWLSWFGVASAARGAGMGAQLVTSLIGTLPRRKAHKLWCDTRTDNRASQVVLERLGFVQIARVTNHWYGQDFFLWEKYPD